MNKENLVAILCHTDYYYSIYIIIYYYYYYIYIIIYYYYIYIIIYYYYYYYYYYLWLPRWRSQELLSRSPGRESSCLRSCSPGVRSGELQS